MDDPVVSYAVGVRRWRVYRDSGNRLEYVDMVNAVDAPEAARKAVKKHHDWLNDGPEWKVVVIPEDAVTAVTVSFEPQVKT